MVDLLHLHQYTCGRLIFLFFLNNEFKCLLDFETVLLVNIIKVKIDLAGGYKLCKVKYIMVSKLLQNPSKLNL